MLHRSVQTRVAIVALVCVPAIAYAQAAQNLVTQVRAAIDAKDYAKGEAMIAADRARRGVAAENILAESWLGRGALAEQRWDAAEQYVTRAHALAMEQLKTRAIDADPFLPGAVGNAIDVFAGVLVGRGARSEAVSYLQRELASYRNTGIEKRIQKTLNTLTLEGTQAPALDLSEYIGARPPALADLKGRPVLLFFWAHWCADCKAQAPILTALYEKYKAQGLLLVAPTQRYGYVLGGKDAGPAAEKTYIEQVRAEYYPVLAGVPMPLTTANHLRYGVSTTPTITLVDRQGIVRVYNPGRMTAGELEAAIKKVL